MGVRVGRDIAGGTSAGCYICVLVLLVVALFGFSVAIDVVRVHKSLRWSREHTGYFLTSQRHRGGCGCGAVANSDIGGAAEVIPGYIMSRAGQQL